MDNDAVRERKKDSVRDEQALIALVDEVIANGEGQLVCRPQEPILLARDGYERYLDEMREPSDRLATKLIPGVEEAWDALTARTEVMPLLTHEGSGAGPGAGWAWTINACDLGDGRRIYTEMQSGDIPTPGIHLIAATDQPAPSTDELVLDSCHASQNGRILAELEAEADGDDDELY